MPDYVYALHDFLPENDDEVSFRQGERIEVIERDDLYSDGWWQGRNLAGRTGLFPQSYTTPAPPSAPEAPSTEHPVTGAVHQTPHEDLASRAPTQNGITNGHGREMSQGDEVMKATMTDVQKAIEQLGINNGSTAHDDARSFSFASTRTGGDGDLTDHDTDTDLDTDREEDGAAEGWHRDARTKLAEQSRKVVEAQKRREEEETPSMRSIAPPIEVEMSDESEGEDEDDGHHHQHLGFTREHPHIPEEDEDDFDRHSRHAEIPEEDHHMGEEAPETARMMPGSLDPPTPADESAPVTAVRDTFQTLIPAILPILPIHAPSPVKANNASVISLPTPTSPDETTHPILAAEPKPPTPAPAPAPAPEPTPAPPMPTLSVQERPSAQITPTPSMVIDLPSPPASSAGQLQAPVQSSYGSPGPLLTPPKANSPVSKEVAGPKKPTTHPSEWTVEEVTEWLRFRGFGDDVCDKFIEQEITGDVLMDLDANLLKSEIGIPAFGKRMRIANAITELRRPPSVTYSDVAPSHTQSPTNTSQSQTQSYAYTHSHTQSVQSSAQTSLNSPMYSAGFSPMNGVPSAGYSTVMSVESPPNTGDIAGSLLGREPRRISDPISSAGISVSVNHSDDEASAIKSAMESSAGVGLGLGVPAAVALAHKNRPAQLLLSPSDSNLGSKAKAVGDIPEETEEDRGVLSENDTAPKARRRIFGRSAESGAAGKRNSIVSQGSNEGNSPRTSSHPANKKDSVDEGSVVSRHSRGKKSVDGSKPADRLSLFGSAFNGSIGKSRKPAPRYSSYVDSDTTPGEKQSSMSLSRLYGSSSRKPSGRPSLSDAGTSPATSPKEAKDAKERDEKKSKPKEKENKEEVEKPATLRKRSAPEPPTETAFGPLSGMDALKPGQSVLEQIGQTDHSGWMRKKGDRYNSWKNRYFVISGPHLYILKSADRAETKIKGYINIVGYRVLADENTDPGRYGFRIVHETDKPHFFSSSEKSVIREWMKAIMKATINRDYAKAVVSSCNIPTIPLTVAQAMSPAPRPPSPTARAATQKAHRQENPNQLSSRDARVLMGLGGDNAGAPDNSDQDTLNQKSEDGKARSITAPATPKTAPPRPSRESREVRRGSTASEMAGIADQGLIDWANGRLPQALRITDPNGSLCGGLALLRLAESIRGKPCSPPVPDSAFPIGADDDKLEGLFRLFDFLLDNDVKTGSVSINEVRQGKREKIIQLLRALKGWDDRRQAISDSIGKRPPPGSPSMSPYGMQWGHM